MTVASAVGNAWSYTVGQCTYFVAQTLPWIPAGLGNASQWASGARAKGLTVAQAPVVGSAVVYGQGNGYSAAYGHVAVVTSVDPTTHTFGVREENYKGEGIVSNRVSGMRDVVGFILPPSSYHGAAIQGGPAGQVNATTVGWTDDAANAVQGVLDPGRWMAGWLGDITGWFQDVGVRVLLILFGLVVVMIGLKLAFSGDGTDVTVEAPAAAGGPEEEPAAGPEDQDQDDDEPRGEGVEHAAESIATMKPPGSGTVRKVRAKAAKDKAAVKSVAKAAPAAAAAV